MTTDRARISAEEEASSQAPPGLREDNASAIPPTVALPGAASRPPLAPPPRPGRGFAPLRTATLLGMQQTLGNRAVQRLLQRAKADAAPGTAAQDQDLAARLRNAGDGQPLDASAQRRLEAGLGADLSGVRVHADAEADRLSRAVEATAFTTGSDIFFRAGAYNPASSGGLQTLAHEAAHVVQQAAGPV